MGGRVRRGPGHGGALRQLFDGDGHRYHHSGGCLHPGLSAEAGERSGRAHEAPGKDPEPEAGSVLMNLAETVRSKFPAEVTHTLDQQGDPVVYIKREAVVKVMSAL